MLVSHTKKFIFLKTVKTGGTSVEGALERYCLPPGTPTPLHARPETVSEYGIVGARHKYLDAYEVYFSHMPAADLRHHLGEDIWNTYYKVTVVRHPYEKTISSFFFNRSRNNAPDTEQNAEETKQDFRAFVMKKQFARDRHIFTLNGELAIDSVLRHEMMVDDLKALNVRLGLEFEPDHLPNFKSGLRPRSATVENLITPDVADVIDEAFQFEFDHFGYDRLDEKRASSTERAIQT